MKNVLLVCLVLIGVSISSCDTGDSESFPITDLVGTYRGAMNVQDPDFTNAQYTVTVTQLSSTAVKIEPSTSAATEWTATLTKIAGVYTCLGCLTSNQITFTSLSNGIELTYNYGGNNEQFAGLKQ